MINIITVSLEIPAKIIEGLNNGELERTGSVIRKKGSKTVVAWLQETGEQISQTKIEELITQQGECIAKLLTNQHLMLGMQAAGLAVSVAGFAVMNHKLNNISKQLCNIEKQLEALGQAHAWLDTKHFFAQLAPVSASMKDLSTLHLIGSKQNAMQKLMNADSKLADAKHYFHQALGQCIAEKWEYQYPEEFASHYHAWLIAAKSHIYTQAHLNELKLAQAFAIEFEEQHADFGKQLMALRNAPETALLRNASPQSNLLMANTLQTCAGAHEILKGNILQLEHMEKTGLRMDDLRLTEAVRNAGHPFVLMEAS